MLALVLCISTSLEGYLPNFTDLPKNFGVFTGKNYFTKPSTELTPRDYCSPKVPGNLTYKSLCYTNPIHVIPVRQVRER